MPIIEIVLFKNRRRSHNLTTNTPAHMRHGVIPPPTPTAVLRGHRSGVTCCAFLSPSTLCSGDSNGDVLVWSVHSKRSTYVMPGMHPGGVLNVLSCTRATWISQGRSDGTVATFDVETMNETARFHTRSESFCRVHSVGGVGDTFTFACTTRNENEIALWDVRSATPRATFATPMWCEEKWGMVMDVKLMTKGNDGIFVVAAYEDGAVRCFDTVGDGFVPDMTVKVQNGHNAATSVAISVMDGDGIVGAMAGGSSSELALFKINISSLKSTQATFVSAFHSGGSLEIQKASSGESDEESKFGRGIAQIALRPDGRIAAMAGWDHRVRIVHFRTGKHLAVLKYHRESVQSVAFSPDSILLASGSKDQNVAVWDSLYAPTAVSVVSGTVAE